MVELTPEYFLEILKNLRDPKRLFVDFSQDHSAYRKLMQMSAQKDSSEEVLWAKLHCGKYYTWCKEHVREVRPWNSLRLFHAGATEENFNDFDVEFPLAVLSGVKEDERWEKTLAFSKALDVESGKNLADAWKSEWSNNRPQFDRVGVEEIRDDNYEEAFNWVFGHESRQLFILYTGILKTCKDQQDQLEAALMDVSPDVPVRMGMVNCDTDNRVCKAASVASYGFANHFMGGNSGNACPMNVGGPKGSASFRGPLNKDTVAAAILTKFEGKPADKDYKRRVPLMIDGESKKAAHDEF